ncbi:hypothetical protein PCASD_15808 [Puccinia coronata f. sp. avenae]|uniref:Uncharacterized protein n=1 Tax=Puccinia coronata f. sp. avenae TaxID=200324 RepID=A0A2N5TTS6_9BASI|nr:hypothetical protein PCASD_15808 [Puccinia coronata f. sp. avenae]
MGHPVDRPRWVKKPCHPDPTCPRPGTGRVHPWADPTHPHPDLNANPAATGYHGLGDPELVKRATPDPLAPPLVALLRTSLSQALAASHLLEAPPSVPYPLTKRQNKQLAPDFIFSETLFI